MSRRVHHRHLVAGCLAAALCVVVVAGLALRPPAARADGVTGTYVGAGVGQGVQFERHDRARSAWAGTLRFQLDEGEEVLVFCIQLDVTTGAGQRYQRGGSVEEVPNGCRIRYLLERYPGSTATDAVEAAARQMAIWHFSDEVDLTTITTTLQTVRDRAIEIAAEAESGECTPGRTEPPSLAVEPQGAAVAAGDRVAYTVSTGSIDGGRPFTATLSGPAVFDDGTQSGGGTLDGGGRAVLGVRATGPGTFRLEVGLAYRLDAGLFFSGIDPEHPVQRLVMAQSADGVARAFASGSSTEATATPVTPTPFVTAAAVPTDTTAPTATGTATAIPSLTAPATAVVTLTVGPTVTRVAGSRRTDVPAAPTARPQLPSQLPSTGTGGGATSWVALALAAVLVTAGAWIRSVARD